jgi:hypothetical protein
MRNTPLLLLPLLLAAVLTSCTGAAKLAAYQRKPLPKLEHPLQVEEVVILDQRADASAGEIRLPFVSSPGTYIKHVPALTAAHRDVLETTIREHTTNRGRSVKGVITVEENRFLQPGRRPTDRGTNQQRRFSGAVRQCKPPENGGNIPAGPAQRAL